MLQRKCASCANSGSECAECRKKRTFALQPKLTINEPGDRYEQEADRIAAQVMTMPAQQAASSAPPRIQRLSGEAVAVGRPSVVPDSVHQTLASPGRPLESTLRQDMGQRFGYDFSRVRVHTSRAAEQSARDVNAHAYTVGQNIVFGAGQFAPRTQEGRRLLAHELAHVVQQSDAGELHAGKSSKKCSLSLSADCSVARKPRTGATGALPSVVQAMAREEARSVLVAYVTVAGVDDALAAMNAIQETLDMPFTMENASMRLQLLTAAFSLLDEEDAAIVLKALTKPVGAEQKHLHERFGRLDSDFRRLLLDILRERAAAKPAPEPEQAEEPAAVAPTATWVELHSGVFAYVPNRGKTLKHVAAYVSGHPNVPEALGQLNDLPLTTPIPEGQSVIIPIEFIDRPKAFQEMPEAVRSRIISMRKARAQQERYLRFVQVKSGHPLGPGASGLFPVTMALTEAAIESIVSALKSLIEKVGYAIAFAGGVIHGFLKSIWDAVSGIAKLIYDVLKSIISLELISDVKKLVSSIKKLSWDKITDAVGEWAAGWVEKLQSKNPLVAGHAHGYLTGYVMAEAAMFLLTGGQIAALKGSIWTSKLGQVVKTSRVFKTLETAVAKAKILRAGSPKFNKAVDTLRQSRLGTAIKAAEVTGAAVVWTADKVAAVLRLPSSIAGYVVEKAVAHAKQLEPFFERIGELSERAKRWLFGCRSPCEWEAGVVANTMQRLTNDEIEGAAKFAAEAKEARRARGPATSTSEEVVRRGADGSIVIQSEVGPPAKRKDYERKLLPGVKVRLKGWERAHSQGAGTGAEAKAGIFYAPPKVNQELQNRGIEKYIRELYVNKPADVKLFLTTETKAYPGTLRLKTINYRVEAERGGQRRILFEASLEVENKRANPKVTVETTPYAL
ncbi:hypothetical protein NOC27_567 [Nitrosococcus oceani AFC27]|nr:hypothetical protein NOC27_567 [Nitrosococcus oceani AFC27]